MPAPQNYEDTAEHLVQTTILEVRPGASHLACMPARRDLLMAQQIESHGMLGAFLGVQRTTTEMVVGDGHGYTVG